MVSRSLSGLPLTHDKTARDLPQLSSQLNSIPYYSAPHDPSTRHHYLNVAQAQPRANSTPQLPFYFIHCQQQQSNTGNYNYHIHNNCDIFSWEILLFSELLCTGEQQIQQYQQFKSIFTSPLYYLLCKIFNWISTSS
ncbi:BEM_collapsed_G0058130.mRNA.1.CDS.1 [Saccharomyces cerevisiae]|nr:BEM_collapsed_G0058130.mRNA.1.CDS.1 [Saccharomyces cerevisiae]